MYELVDLEDGERKNRIRRAHGKYNDVPNNFKEITEEEFSKSHFSVYDPEVIENRQIIPDRKKFPGSGMLPVVMYHYWDGTGLAISCHYWEGKVRYYSFSECDHDYRELSQEECRKKKITHFGMCWHVYECEKCGFRMSQDSSG